MVIDHPPALEVGSLPLLSTRPERMSEKAQFYGEETEVCTREKDSLEPRPLPDFISYM